MPLSSLHMDRVKLRKTESSSISPDVIIAAE